MEKNQNKSNIVEQMVDGIAGTNKENLTPKEADTRKRLSHRTAEYLMLMDEEECENLMNEAEIFRFAEDGVFFQYDKTFEVIIIRNSSGVYMQIEKDKFHLSDLENNGNYMRAIFLGQGCWERLDSITKETSLDLLREWCKT